MQNKLTTLYGNIDVLDVFVGALIEKDTAPSTLGPLFSEILMDQLLRLRDGDRYYFENQLTSGFTDDEVAVIQRTKLADIILWNTNITALPCSAMLQSPVWDCRTDGGSGNTTSRSTSVLNGLLKLNWTLYEEAMEVEITLTGNTNGWIGFGLPTNAGTMVHSDVIIGQFWNNEMRLSDVWIGDSRVLACPQGVCNDTQLGGTNDILNYSGWQINGVTSFTYRRKYDTNDRYDRLIVPGPMPVIMAMGNGWNLGYHGPNKASSQAAFLSIPGIDPANNYDFRVPLLSDYTLQIGRAVQQECRDRSRMPSSA
eukprot:TRINITY_DN43251_c0_g1_i5.p1 TRINITY_DN43251_c0_g1~~TRINITY_DN43251_c0_g1_i5.p1  ORF type:complete len:311 (+),score=23.61 TRINITY_DN43251_c0_g1_i5:84-1016(+)